MEGGKFAPHVGHTQIDRADIGNHSRPGAISAAERNVSGSCTCATAKRTIRTVCRITVNAP